MWLSLNGASSLRYRGHETLAVVTHQFLRLSTSVHFETR